ncbi:hypothetical protein BN1843_9510 [Escherichia coli]|nr:hypothetical protein BN1843_9510 [Escherichia coli]
MFHISVLLCGFFMLLWCFYLFKCHAFRGI